MRPLEVFSLFMILVAMTAAVFLLVEKRVRRVQEAQPEIEVDWNSVVDDPQRKLTITWLGSRSFVTSRDGTWIERNLEARFNVELKPVFVDGVGYQRRRPLMVLSGNIPDVLWSPDPHFVQKDTHHGFLLEIPHEVILKYAPTHVKVLNQYAPVAWIYAYAQGKNWGIPTYFTGTRRVTPGVWRMDWLRNVGIEKVPETLDEMHEALWRFRYSDPDGNGIRDTYGESPLRNWSRLFEKIFGAYHILPFSWMLQEDGTVTWGGLLPRNKEVLALLRQWQAEDLFDPDFYSRQVNSTLTQAQFHSGRVGWITELGDFRHMVMIPGSFAYRTHELQPMAELAPGRILTGPYGKGVSRVWRGGGHSVTFGKHLQKEPWKVIRVLRMVEAMATDEQLYLEAKLGKRGLHWDYNDQIGIHAMPEFEALPQRDLISLSIDVSPGFYAVNGAPEELVDKFSPPEAIEYRRKYRPVKGALGDVFGKPGVLPSAGIYLADLQHLQMTTFLEIIRSDRPLSDFDQFVRQWKAQGGNQMLKEANELLLAKRRIYYTVGVPGYEVEPARLSGMK